MSAAATGTKKPAPGATGTGRDDNPSRYEGVAVMTSMAQRARTPQPRATCTVKWCTGCTWREDGEGWSRLHRAIVDGLVEVFAGESVHASEGTEHAPASVIVLGAPDELETPESTCDLAAALTKAARIQTGHRAVAR